MGNTQFSDQTCHQFSLVSDDSNFSTAKIVIQHMQTALHESIFLSMQTQLQHKNAKTLKVWSQSKQ